MGASKCSESQILSAPKYEFDEVQFTEEIITSKQGGKKGIVTYDFTLPWEMTDDKVRSALTQFMLWASLTRDMEMQKGK